MINDGIYYDLLIFTSGKNSDDFLWATLVISDDFPISNHSNLASKTSIETRDFPWFHQGFPMETRRRQGSNATLMEALAVPMLMLLVRQESMDWLKGNIVDFIVI